MDAVRMLNTARGADTLLITLLAARQTTQRVSYGPTANQCC